MDLEVFRITLLGSAQVGKTTFATTIITKTLSQSNKYLRTRRNEFFFTKLRGIGLQFQDTVGGKEMPATMDELRAIRDEERSGFGGAGAGTTPTPGSLDEDESSMLLTKREGNPLLAYLKTAGYIVMYDTSRRETYDHAAALIRDIVRTSPQNDPIPIIVIGNRRDVGGGGMTISGGNDIADEARKLHDYHSNLFYFLGSVLRNDYSLIQPPTVAASSSSVSDMRPHCNADDVVMFLVQRMKKSHMYEMLVRQKQLQQQQAMALAGIRETSSTGSTEDDDGGGATWCNRFCCACCCVQRKGDAKRMAEDKTSQLKSG